MMREKCTEKSRHSMPGNRRKKTAEYRGKQNKTNRGIPRGTEQSNKPLKERKKENGKDHDDVRDCVYIGTRGELLLKDDEGDRAGVYAPS